MKNNLMTYWSLTFLVVATLSFGETAPASAEMTVYTDEAAYLNALTNLSVSTLQEGFEDDAAWGSSRSPLTVASVTRSGIVWTSNFTANRIKTGGGPVRTGLWGLLSDPHGDPDRQTSILLCDVESVPPECFQHDGIKGTAAQGASPFFGVGAWITGTAGGNILFVLDGNEANPVDFGDQGVVTAAHKFFGVIDTAGFSTFEIRETEGKTGDEKVIGADDFSLGLMPATAGKAMPGVPLLLLDK